MNRKEKHAQPHRIPCVLQQMCSNIKSFEIPSLMSYKRNKNLRNKLVRTDFGSNRKEMGQRTLMPVKIGNCLHCSYCSNMVKEDSFTHSNTGRKFKIKERFTCSLDHVVYMLNCPCWLIYVGAFLRKCMLFFKDLFLIDFLFYFRSHIWIALIRMVITRN